MGNHLGGPEFLKISEATQQAKPNEVNLSLQGSNAGVSKLAITNKTKAKTRRIREITAFYLSFLSFLQKF